MNASPVYFSLLRRYLLHWLATGSLSIAILVSTAALAISGAAALNGHGARDGHNEVVCHTVVKTSVQGIGVATTTAGQTEANAGTYSVDVYLICNHEVGD